MEAVDEKPLQISIICKGFFSEFVAVLIRAFLPESNLSIDREVAFNRHAVARIHRREGRQ
jgi:hypothetical protein